MINFDDQIEELKSIRPDTDILDLLDWVDQQVINVFELPYHNKDLLDEIKHNNK